MKNVFVISAFAVATLLTACGGDKTKENAATETVTDQGTTSNATAVSNIVEITANDAMKFDKEEIRVKANEKVTLTLTNIGKMPIETMGHNFVLLNAQADLSAFTLKAYQSPPDFIPADMGSVIVAHTKLLGPGESETIEFTVPAGDYTYICTFTGHYPAMMGILTAE